MAKGGRFVPKRQDSQELYNRSRDFLILAQIQEPDYKFTYANLSNLERLSKNYDEAVTQYDLAIKQDEKYVNGYSELAWVYLDAGNLDMSHEKYEIALQVADTDKHKSKVKEYYARLHWYHGKIDETKKLIVEALDLDKKNENLELIDWISIEKELKHLIDHAHN